MISLLQESKSTDSPVQTLQDVATLFVALRLGLDDAQYSENHPDKIAYLIDADVAFLYANPVGEAVHLTLFGQRVAAARLTAAISHRFFSRNAKVFPMFECLLNMRARSRIN